MGRKTHTLIFPFEPILPRTEHPLALLIIKKAREPLVSCPDPTLTRREKGLVTIERYLGCAESAISCSHHVCKKF